MSHFEAILSIHQKKLRDLERRLVKAIEQLNDDDVNWRPNEESNSISNIVLHISGNLRQRFNAGIGGNPDTRNRDAEFDTRERFTKTQLIEMVNETFGMVHRTLLNMKPEMLDDVYSIQGSDVTVLEIIFGVATHISEHVGQVLFIAKMRLGNQYQVLWMPKQK